VAVLLGNGKQPPLKTATPPLFVGICHQKGGVAVFRSPGPYKYSRETIFGPSRLLFLKTKKPRKRGGGVNRSEGENIEKS